MKPRNLSVVGYVEHLQLEDLLARFFGINLNKVEAEKRELLEDLRG